jgi:SAM-dependent methyltransferase
LSIGAIGGDSAAMTEKSAVLLFDSRAQRRHRARAAKLPEQADFLVKEAAEALADRLDDVKRRFPVALDLGCRDGVMARALRGRGGIECLVSADPAPEFAKLAPLPALACEAEYLPFAPHAFDLVLSNLVLHWTNDLPGALIQLRQALRPGGLLLASLFGGETLTELGTALMEAELEIEGGAGPRVSPFADLRDLGGLLQRAGYKEPVVDGDRIEVTYPGLLALMHDLRAMGESNALIERRRGFSRRDTLARAAEIYGKRFPAPGGRIRAGFQVISLTAWAPG